MWSLPEVSSRNLLEGVPSAPDSCSMAALKWRGHVLSPQLNGAGSFGWTHVTSPTPLRQCRFSLLPVSHAGPCRLPSLTLCSLPVNSVLTLKDSKYLWLTSLSQKDLWLRLQVDPDAAPPQVHYLFVSWEGASCPRLLRKWWLSPERGNKGHLYPSPSAYGCY